MSATDISMLINGITSLKNMVESFITKEERKTLEVTQKPLRRISLDINIAKSSLKSYDSNKPSLVVNNIDGISKIKEIAIAPDTNFKTKGLFKILVDNTEIAELKSVEVFQIVDVLNIKIPEGLTLKSNDKIKILMISSDGSEVKMAVTITFGVS